MRKAWFYGQITGLLIVAFMLADTFLLPPPLFASRNIVHDAWKLQKKLRKDPNVEKVVESYIVRSNGGYDEFEVYVIDCYNHESLHRIPTYYKGTPVRIHCVGIEHRPQPLPQ